MTLHARVPTLALAILALLAVAGSAAARSRVVRVPRLHGDVIRAYATLHRDGLRVSITHPFTLRTDAVTVVSASAPTAGRRVRRGSVVTLTVRCCQRLRHAGRSPAGRSTVPNVTAYPLDTARGWAVSSQRHLLARLAAMRAATQPSLLANYVVSRQTPGAGSVLSGNAPLSVSARVGRAAACLAPLYGVTVVKNDLAEISMVSGLQSTRGDTGPGAAYYGCVDSANRQVRLSTTVDGANVDYHLLTPALAGTEFAAVTAIGGGRYGNRADAFGIHTWDIATGVQDTVLEPQSAFLDQLRLNAAGFTAWRAVTLPGGTSTALQDVSCPTATFCAAVDAAGSVFTAANPAGGRGAWTQTALPVSSLSGVSCQSPTLCVAVSGMQVFVSTNPTGGASAWSATAVPGAALSAVSCPTTTLCVAMGQNGIATSTNPTGGPSAWSFGTVSGGHTLDAVSCPSTGLCVASDSAIGNIASATNPSAGASAWSVADVNGNQGLSGVGCASPSLCVAGDHSGDMLSSTNPSGGLPAWQLTHVGTTSFTRFSCPASSLCVGGAPSGAVTSGTPTGGDGAWTLSPIAGTGTINSVSCPTPALCVAVDDRGQIISSSNPSGGGSAWSTALVDAPACAVAAGCRTEQIAAHDGAGMRTLDSTGPGSGAQLQKLSLTDNQLTWTHDGTAQSATLG